MDTRNLLGISMLMFAIGLSGCEREVSFAKNVQPILNSDCVQCHDHGAEGVENSGLSLASYEGVMRGTKFGVVVIPGDGESSTLYMVVANKTDPKIHMPPHHEMSLAEGRGDVLNEDQVNTIKAWIDQGAKNN